MRSFARWLTKPIHGEFALVIQYAAIATLIASLTEILISWLFTDPYVYFFYEGAAEDFRDFPIFSTLALVLFPFGEEIVFRGPLMWVRNRWGIGSVLGWVSLVAALVFARIHGGIMPQFSSAIIFTAVYLRAVESGKGFWRAIYLAGLTHLIQNALLGLLQITWNGVIVPNL